MIPWIALAFGWRWAFVFSGLLGFLWLAAWLRIYYAPDCHPRVSPQEIELVNAGRAPTVHPRERTSRNWLHLAKDRNVWGIVLGRAFTDPIWSFYVFWLPQYLSDARSFSLQRIALFAWVPFVAADMGNFTGGPISGYCIRKGMTVLQARKWVCAVSCLPVLLGIPAARVDNPSIALLLISVALWGYASWSTMGLTLPSDLFPQNVVATVTALSGLVAGLAGAGFTYAVGRTVDRFFYLPAFVVAGLLPLLATAAVFLLIRPIPVAALTTEGTK